MALRCFLAARSGRPVEARSPAPFEIAAATRGCDAPYKRFEQREEPAAQREGAIGVPLRGLERELRLEDLGVGAIVAHGCARESPLRSSAP
jgi:hypothetical protein